jgi:ABC-type nitrate/sulfonate/bicarbonate transport system substrate-binding protein
MVQKIRVGQFSQSPVLIAMALNNFLPNYEIEITNVVSSPAQYGSLMKGELDIAITSPDNVLLYATTPDNPIGAICDLTMLRSIDRGMNLSLVSTPEISDIESLAKAKFAIDSPTSGFALLLNAMLRKLEIDTSTVNFIAAGSTPKRLIHMIEGSSQASILNAESRIQAGERGFKSWISVSDISSNYLGSVICVVRSIENSQMIRDFMTGWKKANDWLLEINMPQYLHAFGTEWPLIGSENYFALLHDPVHGLTRENALNLNALQTLITLREESMAYVPPSANLTKLLSVNYN